MGPLRQEVPMSAGRNKRRAALRGEEAEREAWRQAFKASGRTYADLTDDEAARIYDVRPLERDPEAIQRLASICTRCGKEGHRAKSCPEFVCHACGEPGHKAARCPKVRKT